MTLENINRLFISIPMSGVEKESREHCNEYKRRLQDKFPNIEFISGWDVNTEKGKKTSYYMGRDIEALMECDGIISCDKWWLSKGCQVERFTAKCYGLRVFEIEDLLDDVSDIGSLEVK